MARRNPATPEPCQPPGPDPGRGRPPSQGDPFKKPERPSGVWQTLGWVVFEYPLLLRYEQTLHLRQWVPHIGSRLRIQRRLCRAAGFSPRPRTGQPVCGFFVKRLS
jgi:hypothetical protein